jgi:hypothetical protein
MLENGAANDPIYRAVLDTFGGLNDNVALFSAGSWLVSSGNQFGLFTPEDGGPVGLS